MPKKIISIRAIISDHAILRYKERFNVPNGNSKKALKSILKKGKIVLACDGRNMVVAKDRTYLIISNGAIIDEIADVYIMLGQLLQIYNIYEIEVEHKILIKIGRLKSRLEK